MPYRPKAQPAQVPFLKQYLAGMKARGMGQTCYDENGDPFDCSTPTTAAPIDVTVPSTPLTPISTTSPSSTGNSLTNLLNSITQSAVNGARIYNALQTPSLIPGTGAIYNPATGQYYNPTTGQVVEPNGASTFGAMGADISAYLPTILLYGGLALGAYMLIRMVER